MPRQKKGKRGSIINKWGVKITRKEQLEIDRLKKQIDKVREQLQAQLDRDQELRSNIHINKNNIVDQKSGKVKKVKVKNKFQDDYENFHLEDPLLPKKRSANKNQFKNRGLLEAWIKTAKEITKDPQGYLTTKTKQFHENYLDSILHNYSDGGLLSEEQAYNELTGNVKALYDRVRNMSPEEFYDAYLRGEIPTINENYIPSDEYAKYIEDVYEIYDTYEKHQGEPQMKFDENGDPIDDKFFGEPQMKF